MSRSSEKKKSGAANILTTQQLGPEERAISPNLDPGQR